MPRKTRVSKTFATQISACRSTRRGGEQKPLWFSSVPKGEGTFQPCLITAGDTCVLRNPFNDSRIFVDLYVNSAERRVGWLEPNGTLTVTRQNGGRLKIEGASPK